MEHYELFSARFAFCPLRQEDAQDVYALTGDAQVARYMAFSAHTDLDQARALIEQYNAGAGQGFALRERESGEFIGVFALKEAKVPGRRDISIFLAPSWWGKGCAGEVFAWAIGIRQGGHRSVGGARGSQQYRQPQGAGEKWLYPARSAANRGACGRALRLSADFGGGLYPG